MLVLSRKLKERIVIRTPTEEIVITYLESRNGHIRLGFEAGQGVRIDREEVFLEKQEKGT